MQKTLAAVSADLLMCRLQVRFHTPSIKFRYGKRQTGAAAKVVQESSRAGFSSPQTTAAAAPAASAPAPVRHGSYKKWVTPPSKATKQFYDLPEMYGRPKISDAEANYILGGGAA